MTWLAPWALVAGGLGMLGVVAAHLLSRQRPRALSLATARFLPSGMLEATTLQTIPIDRWWMLLRLLIIALLALGAAQPVITGARVPTRTILLLDRTLPQDAQRSVLASLSPTDVVLAYDSGSAISEASATTAVVSRDAMLSAALGRLVRVRDSLAERSTTLRIAIASRFSPRSLDPAAAPLRALIPDSIVPLPLTVRADSARARSTITVHAEPDDPIAATAQLVGDSAAPSGAVIQRAATLTHDDSVAASNGATVVSWPARSIPGEPSLQAITVARATWLAPLGRDSNIAARSGDVVGRWADGTPAVWRTTTGTGCIVHVGAALPIAGDQTLSLGAQAWLAALLTSCEHDATGVSPAPAWLAAPTVSRRAPSLQQSLTSRFAPWLVASALLLAFLELALRGRRKS